MTKNEARKDRLSYYLKFTVFFILIQLILYLPFILAQKALVWEHDSYTQHLKAMIYISRWYRQMGKSLLHGRFAELGTYTFTIGYGSDAMTTLAYYGVGDPFYILSALVPARYIYLYYCALIPIKNYCCGIAISALLRHLWPGEEHRGGVLSGALIYTFCAFVLITCVGQPIFLNALIVYPMMLLGIEKVYDGGRPWLFILSAFLATVANFYFVVSIVLMAVLYALFRYFPMPLKEVGKRLLQILTMLAGGVVGVAMGGFLLVPMAYTVFGNQRVALDRVIGLFYDARSCRLLPMSFLAAEEVQYGALGYAGLALLCVFLLFSARGRIKLKIQFLLYTFLLFVPYFGYLTNGFSYPINRWCWAYSALIAMIVAEMWPQLFTLTHGQKVSMSVSFMLYFFICNLLDDRLMTSFLMPVIFTALTLIFILLSQRQERQQETGEETASGEGIAAGEETAAVGDALPESGNRRQQDRGYRRFLRAQTGIVLLTALSIGVNGLALNYPGEDSRLNTYKDLRALSGNTSGLGASPANDRNMWINDTAQIVSAAGLSKTEFNRVSNTEPGFWYQNTSMLNGVSTTQSFWSVNNSNVLEYLDLLAVSDVNNNSWQFTNLDSRTALNELASVKYLYCLHPEKLPYGYGKESLDPGSANSVYENQMPLPLGYTYDSVISRETFDKLTPAERQDIMLTHAVVDEPGALGDPRTADALRTDLSCAELPFTASCLDWGVNMSDSTTFAVTNPGAQVRLNFAPVAEGECYLYFDNIQFTKSTYPDLYLGGEDVDPKNQYSKEDWDALSPYERFSIRKNIFDELPLGNIKIGVQFGDGSNADANADLIDSNEINYILPDNYQFYSGRQSFMVNSYPLTKPISSITITFPEMGVYHFDGISVISEPLTGYEEAAKARAAEPLTGLDIHQNETSYTTNRVDGEIDVSGDRLLCLTIPYSEGWTAYVDGVKTPIEKVNVMFMGLRLTSGHHTITLRYETPGLRLGLLITCAGAALLILWAILSHIARRRAKAEPAGD